MGGTRIVVYGLSTEGYALARQMAAAGAEVALVDESTPSAISINAEIAKSYPDVSALKDDEPLLPMEPIDVAVSKAQYLFFTPCIRKSGQDTKAEIHAKFKDAVQSMKKNSSIVYGIPSGFGGNNENISRLEHITGYSAGKSVHYYYYPVSDMCPPKVIGSFGGREDERLAGLLAGEGREGKFVNLSSSEYFHAIDVLARFSTMCGILEVCKFAHDDVTKEDLSLDEFAGIFLDEMIHGMYDLRSLGSVEGANTLMYMINGSIKGIDGYVKRLIDEIRATIKRNELKASRTKIALAWTLDQHEMRGDKMEMLQTLTSKLRDYIGDVEAYEDPSRDIFHTDKTTIVVSCSRRDFESLAGDGDGDLIIIKANPLCEAVVPGKA